MRRLFALLAASLAATSVAAASRAAISLAAIALAASPSPASAAPPPAQVEFAAADGLMLHATYWAADGPGPAMLLLHQCNMDRTMWTGLAERFAAAGVHVLAYDFRGFGESKSDLVGDFANERARLLPDFPSDVDRALGFFATLPDVDINRLGVLGASCGGSQTLLLALREPRVRAIGFFSSSLPGLTDQDFVQFESNTALPILGIAAEKDAGAIERTRRLFDRSSHAETKLVVYKGALHGAPLFEHDPGLAESIVAWFRSIL